MSGGSNVFEIGWHEVLILLGAAIGGFVTGLTGFGTGLAAMPIWLQTASPPVAAALVIICSVTGQLTTLKAILHAIKWRQVGPYIAGGLAGVPLGAWLLAQISPNAFKLIIGSLLVGYSLIRLVRGQRNAGEPPLIAGNRIADGLVGLGGGIFGGFAGLSGVLPIVWANLKGMGKDERRAMFQSFNLSILLCAGIAQVSAGLWSLEILRLAVIALPGTIIAARLGRKVYDRMGLQLFDRLVLFLLLASGVSVILGAVFA